MKTKLWTLALLVSGSALADYQSPPALEGDYARITFYRPSSMQGAAWANPYCIDGQKVAELRNKGYTSVLVKAGAHRVYFCRAAAADALTLNVNFVAGTEYYLRQGPEAKNMSEQLLAADQKTTLTESRNTYAAGVTIAMDASTTFALIKEEFALKELTPFKYKEPLIKSVEAAAP